MLLAVLLAALPAAGCGLEQDIASRASNATRTGTQAPALRADHLDGGAPFDLAAERGHPVVLTFFGSWCGPCVAEQPALNRVATAYMPRGVVVLGVDMREDSASGRAYLRSQSVPYRAVLDGDGSIAAAYGVLSPPWTVVVDASGSVSTVFAGGIGGADLGAALDRLAPPGTAGPVGASATPASG